MRKTAARISALLSVTLAIFAIPLAANCKSANRIPSTSEKVRNAVGKNYCSLSFGVISDKDGVYLDTHKRFAAEQRWEKPNLFLFLLKDSKPPTYCGTIEQVIDLSEMRKTDEYMMFKCRVRDRPYSKIVSILALGSNNLGHIRFVKPSKAWRVDLQSKRFVETDANRIVCDTAAAEE